MAASNLNRNFLAETERLLLRELDFSDEKDLFEMDSDPEVHRFIDKQPVKTPEEVRKVIIMIRKQYQENGIARWAVTEKATGECIGWSGLKFHRNPLNNHVDIYELGYRFKRKHWGKGYATESSKAVIEYAFRHLPVTTLYAITDPDNTQSRRVLEKLGFVLTEIFDYDGVATTWYELHQHHSISGE
ncbi:MAG: GNAT family N-acetyltransferase [Bacteroidota bacterium]